MGEHTVSVAEAKAHFSELLRRAEMNHERINVTRRGRVVAAIVPPGSDATGGDELDWVYAMAGLLRDAPEVIEGIDDAYHSRSAEQPRPVQFPWEDQ